jgi:hypothetical protein
MYPQEAVNHTTAPTAVVLTKDSAGTVPAKTYLPMDSIFKDTPFHKLQPYQDTVKAIPDTTSNTHACKKRLIGGIVFASIVVVYVILVLGLKGLKNAIR